MAYPSNSIWEINYFANPEIMNGFAAWSQLYANLYESKKERVHLFQSPEHCRYLFSNTATNFRQPKTAQNFPRASNHEYFSASSIL
jgi:hypothetical protein